MRSRPSVVVFDFNETLSDMEPMAQRFAHVGAPEHLAELWFATVLRDGSPWRLPTRSSLSRRWRPEPSEPSSAAWTWRGTSTRPSSTS